MTPPSQEGWAHVTVGQRWLSLAEPDLGLGTVAGVDRRHVEIDFPAAEERRRYRLDSAPLQQVRFTEGDEIFAGDGRKLLIDEVSEHHGLAYYRVGEEILPETEIGANNTPRTPRERLLAGLVDRSNRFDLRMELFERRAEYDRSRAKGLLGARIELLPHQFFIASEVSNRNPPRVLLSDETGLGKTIEASLIISRLLQTGKASRVLILTPPTLVHQWLVELKRRFQIAFSVFDELRCREIEAEAFGPDGEIEEHINPFLQKQLVLSSLDLVSKSSERCSQATEAGWDLVVVDEAHHLEWQPNAPSAEYRAVETISSQAEGLLLLTATPEQLGEEGHFARLRLLDPNRYQQLETWREESEAFHQTAAIGSKLLASNFSINDLDDSEIDQVGGLLGLSADETRSQLAKKKPREKLISELVDRYGPGRVIFRNTRRVLPDLPERTLHPIPLEPRNSAAAVNQQLRRELIDSDPRAADLTDDPRFEWLLDWLRSNDEKVLIFCHTIATCSAIKQAIDENSRIQAAVFHQDLNLLQRDRNAAWFAEEDGARLLICSEIGSEGRNFQHVQHMVMFDLPLDPDLVEQRIGRLDRIGQHGAVNIHVPYLSKTASEAIFRWHSEGVDTFPAPTPVGAPLLREFGPRLEMHLADIALNQERLEKQLEEVREAREQLSYQLETGRDRLLELSSLRPEVAEPLLDEVIQLGSDQTLDFFFVRLFEHFSIYTEQLAPRTFLVNPEALASADFPELDYGTIAGTFDRGRALVREDLELLSPDHPLIQDAIARYIDTRTGAASFAIRTTPKTLGFELEVLYLLRAIAPKRLNLMRFLPEQPIRVVVAQRAWEPPDEDEPPIDLQNGRSKWLGRHQPQIRQLLSRLIPKAEEAATERAEAIRAKALEQAQETLDTEIRRLETLRAKNDEVKETEIDAVKQELAECRQAIAEATVQCDAMRLVWNGPSKAGEPRR